MRKKIIYFGVFLLVTGFLSGCSTQKDTESAGDENSNVSRDEMRRPDFGQPERNPDLMGIVKSISGNEVTILKIEMPSEEERSARLAEMGVTEDNTEKTPTAIGVGTGVGGGRGMMGGGRPGGGDRSESDMVDMMKSRASGEEKVMIPVGIRMLKSEIGSDSKGTPVMLEASLEDVKQDTILNIWINKDVTDRQLAEFVFVR